MMVAQLFTKQDEMSIILVGTKRTENPLNDEDSSSYKHVSVFKTLAVPNIQLLESIDEIEAEPAQGDGHTIPISYHMSDAFFRFII